MGKSHRPNVDEVRAVATSIVERAAGDPEFLAKLHSDPEETLIEAGLHESAIGDFMREAGLTPEVAGYILEELDAPCQYSCMPNSTPTH